MAFENEFLDLMPHQIEVHTYLTDDFRGEPNYDPTPRFYRCRIVGKGLALRTRMSEQDTVIYDIYADMKDDPLKLEDQIILPEDQAWIDRTPVIFAIARYTDDEAQHHVKIQCGWMYHRQGQ